MYEKDVVFERIQMAAMDAAVVFASLLIATWLRHGAGLLAPGPVAQVPWSDYLFPATLMALAFVVVFRYHGLYRVAYGRLVEALRVVRAGCIATLVPVALTFFYRGYSYSRATVLIFLPLSIALLIVARNIYRGYRRAVMTHPSARRRVLIVGFGRIGQHLGRELLERPSYYDLVGFVDDDPAKCGADLQGRAVLGVSADLPRIVREGMVEEVLIAIPSACRDRILNLLGTCLRLRVRWKVVPDLYDVMLERMSVDHVGGLPLLGLRGSNIVGFNWALKRAFDVAVAAPALVLASPLFAVIATAIKLTSRGPVFYRQTRVGLGGKPFTFLKFRSMRGGSDTGIHQTFTKEWIYGRTGEAGRLPRSVGAAARAESNRKVAAEVHKITTDPRVTLVGRILRRTSLDEIPQLLNVLRGEMSMVGPRPPIPYEVERYTEWHKRRLEVLPGITGLWQVSGRNALSFEQMVRLDIQYIETWSVEQDVRILLKTVPVVLFGKAY
jgi:exopolysaccharide biosynthesis polyprenyl glycosylphosphotransferase